MKVSVNEHLWNSKHGQHAEQLDQVLLEHEVVHHTCSISQERSLILLNSIILSRLWVLLFCEAKVRIHPIGVVLNQIIVQFHHVLVQ